METVLVIASDIAGKVIGRSGTKIKSVQAQTGATVRVIDGDTADTRLVIVSGNEDVRLAATDILRKVVGRKLLRTETRTPPDESNRRAAEPSKRRSRQRRDESPPEVIKLSDEAWEEIFRDNEERERLLKENRPQIRKDFYVEHSEVTAMSVEDVEAFRAANNSITVEYVPSANDTRPIPKPIKTFVHAFHRYPEIMAVLDKQKFTAPTPVQCQAWPIIMSGHDLIAIAQTGTGKTLAYILPALIHLQRQPTPKEERKGPSVAIVGPTRELVMQIEEEVKKYIFDGILVMSVYGASCIDTQVKRLLWEKPDIVVATPGRLNELIGLKAVDTENVSYLVLDEADRMLDMGFKAQVELALREVRSDRQTILTSATWPESVQCLADYFTKDAVRVNVGSFDLTTVRTVKQEIVILNERKKEYWCLNFIKKKLTKKDKIIIFMRTKVSVDKLYEKLMNQNIMCSSIHGGKLQVDREASLAEVRNGKVPILIATDVASRGLDIDELTLVINYDFPLNIEEYVHRVGRTGRAGKKGRAISLFSKKDACYASSLIKILERSNQSIPDKLYEMVVPEQKQCHSFTFYSS